MIRYWLIVSLLTFTVAMPFMLGSQAKAQNVVVLVNDEPITSTDVAQRMRWAALTSGFGDRMKALLSGDAVKERFRQMMIAANPHSQAEAQRDAERIKKQLIEDAKRQVLNDGGGNSRKAVIEALIEDKLKLQAAKKLEIKISDKEVEDSLVQRMAAADTRSRKEKLDAFYQQFEGNGVGRKAIQEIVRAQLAWRDIIRRQFGPRIASELAALPTTDPKPSESDIQFDVRILRLAVKDPNDQRALSERMLEAENLKEKFRSCATLPQEAQLVANASVKVIEKAKLASFPKDVQPLIEKAAEGQMTPPVLSGNAVESYAICRKFITPKQTAHVEQKPDARQQEYERFSRRYLQQIKETASIDYRGS